ncbi:MAG: restriction endonuclease subunit S [Candidatus Brocadiales bacterium]|nr:restriction endonuclease subunit S [Candidatus Brocadiales bacterium]
MSEVASKVPQLRFPEFKGRWDKETVGGVSKIFGRIGYRGYTVQDIVSKGEGAIALSPSNFINNQIDATKSTYISWFKYEESPEIKILDGDILFVKTGSTYGKTAFVSNIKEKATINPQIVVLKNISISNKFLGYIVTTQTIKKQVEQIVVGGAIPTMSQKELSKMEFGLPAKPEQQKIAAFLTAVDNKIEQLSKKKALLGSWKKGAMQQIFSQTIRFKADDGSEFPDWEEKKLGDVCSKAKSGGTPRSTTKEYYDGDIPFLAISDITRQGKYLTAASKKISQLGINNSASWIVPINTIIYSMYASVGFVSINKIPLATSQAVINLIVKEGYSIEFIYYHLIEIKKTIHKFIETGTQGNLNAQTVKLLILNIPSFSEQTKIANFLSSIDSKIEQVGKQLDESKQFKKALLQQMFV